MGLLQEFLGKVRIEDYCPSCGNWVDRLVVDAGWCASCFVQEFPEQKVCPDCYSAFPASTQTKYCSSCKTERWLEQHADRIEAYLLVGYTYTSAKRQVAHDIRPACVICGNAIIGGNSDALFCKRTKYCRRAKRRFNLYRADHGMDRESALARAIAAHNSEGAINEHGAAA